MANASYTRDARADVKAAWNYLHAKSPPAATRFINALDRGVALHAAQPRMGRRRDDYGPGYRTFVVEGYVVIYRATRGGILVLRVLHGSRDIAAVFADD